MSRTVRNRSKNGGLNAYAKYQRNHIFTCSYFNDQEKVDNFETFYRRDGKSSEGVPKSFTKILKRGAKAKDKAALRTALYRDELDNLPKFKFIRDAAYLYW